ncbi:hypothetical protein CPB86DRAFT_802477 [Serendipita vermifera]|nr:hypothetical protein CPB86DRAFT_802477 [Serendipita vermifera]
MLVLLDFDDFDLNGMCIKLISEFHGAFINTAKNIKNFYHLEPPSWFKGPKSEHIHRAMGNPMQCALHRWSMGKLTKKQFHENVYDCTHGDVSDDLLGAIPENKAAWMELQAKFKAIAFVDIIAKVFVDEEQHDQNQHEHIARDEDMGDLQQGDDEDVLQQEVADDKDEPQPANDDEDEPQPANKDEDEPQPADDNEDEPQEDAED